MKKSIITGLSLVCMTAGQGFAEPATFPTPFDALIALVDAASTDREAVMAVFGPENEDLFPTRNAVEENQNRTAFLNMYREGYRMEPQEDGSVVIALGADAWPFPIPLAKTDDGWAFDSAAGAEEMRNREIGGNELEIIDLMTAYGDVQVAFRLLDHDGDGVMEFARQIISSPDKRDGLFWPGPDSPFGVNLARASTTGYSDGTTDHDPDPYMGYYFRILTGQTDAAPGGAMSYLVNGNMVAGHALLAAPADYGHSGVHSFLVSENGVILQADLGEDTLDLVSNLTEYDPGEDWVPVGE